MNDVLRGPKLAFPLFLVATLIGVLPTPAHAHARYVGSDPADGEKLESAPTDVTAEYSEPLEPDSHMEVYDPCGQRVDAGDVRVTGYEMSVSMSSDSAGTFVVAWTAASAIDPHVTKGNFTFSVTEGTDCNAPTQEPAKDDDQKTRDSNPNDSSGNDGRSNVASGSGDREASSTVSGTEKKRQGKHAGHKNMRRPARSATRQAVPQAQPQDPEEPAESDEIPVSSLLVALGISVVIGASGGWVYAGLLGPRR